MKVPLSWLREYVDVDIDQNELAHRMTLAGTEAEAVQLTGATWDQITVGLVTEINPHPDADRLRLATVDTGEGLATVVCGAPNLAPGQRVALARIGANLIDSHTGEPMTLKAAKIRGVKSDGMICSERELGISEEHEGILVLPDDAPVGTAFTDYYGDIVIDFTPTPNRPDCLSMLGIAREVAAITGKNIREPSLASEELAEAVELKTNVEIHDPELCTRYIAGVVTEVSVGPSPVWLQKRLQQAGIRSINNIVDITNFVMLEFGQPLHAFDYDKLKENRIIVRRGRETEEISTIDGQRRKLNSEMLVIADAGESVAIAGVMGGARSEVTTNTTTVLLESAAFNSISIRRTSRWLSLRSEASARFDKGLSQELPIYAARRAIKLLVEIAGGRACKGLIDNFPGKSESQQLKLTKARAGKVLGRAVRLSEMTNVLESLGFTVDLAGRQALTVTPPYWRTDIEIEEDLIEEIARIKGYDWIPTTTPSGNLPSFEPQPMLELKRNVRETMVSSGLTEIVTYPLTKGNLTHAVEGNLPPLRVANPLSSEMEELRVSLQAGILKTLSANQQGSDSVRLFELGRVYRPQRQGLPDECEVLAAVLSGTRDEPFWQKGSGNLDFFDGKGVLDTLFETLGAAVAYAPSKQHLLHPSRTAVISINGTEIGVIGELDPTHQEALNLLSRSVIYIEVDLRLLLTYLPDRPHTYHAIPRFPGLNRDLALIVNKDVPVDKVMRLIRAAPLVQRADLFDIYSGEQVPVGKKSFALRLMYQSPGRTLTNAEADKTQRRLLSQLEQELGATLRESILQSGAGKIED